jgi:hypothetical protein
MLAFILPTYALTPLRTPSSDRSHLRVRDLLALRSIVYGRSTCLQFQWSIVYGNNK